MFVCARACECVFVHACIQIDKTSTHTLKSVHIQLYIRYRMDHFYLVMYSNCGLKLIECFIFQYYLHMDGRGGFEFLPITSETVEFGS